MKLYTKYLKKLAPKVHLRKSYDECCEMRCPTSKWIEISHTLNISTFIIFQVTSLVEKKYFILRTNVGPTNLTILVRI